MPQSLEIIIAIVGIAGSILGILGITSYANTRMLHKAEKKNIENDRIEMLKYNEYLGQLKNIINVEISPVKDTLDDIKNDLTSVKNGTQATCRNDLEEMYEKAEKAGYCSSDDKMKFEATYQAYHSLGKNGVMDVKREKLLQMPETKIRKKNSQIAKVPDNKGE